MPKPRQILSRRKTVQNICKITRTMEMIATGRFRQIGNRVAQVRAYTDGIDRMVYHTAQDAKLKVHQPLLEHNDDAPADALIVTTSNRGMCGGYNTNILRLAREVHEHLLGEGRTVNVYAVGVKARTFLRFHGVEPVWFIPQFERKVDLDAVDALADDLMAQYVDKSLRTVQIVYATYESTSVQRPEVLTLLPLGETTRAPTARLPGGGRRLGPGEYDYMPTPDEILSELLPRSVSLRLYQVFLDSILSEQVARMTSMHLANENGGEMVRLLTMEYNRARQATITTELAEIVTGVEAMK